MRIGSRKALVVASAILAGVGMVRGAGAAALTQDTSPATIDGWTISWPTGVGLDIVQDSSVSSQVDVEKTATFTAPGQGFQITFAPTPGASATASTFVIPDESIINETGKPFGSFSFILLGSGATFAGALTPGFIPPTGPGYNYTSVSLVNGKTELDYIGTQGNGVTSFWGNGDPSSSGDNLVIDATPGESFTLKELALPGSGPVTVPMPAALWQSLIVLGGVGLFVAARGLKRRTA